MSIMLRDLEEIIGAATRNPTPARVEAAIDESLLWFLEEKSWVFDFLFYDLHLTLAVEKLLLTLQDLARGARTYNRGHIAELLLPLLHRGKRNDEQTHNRVRDRARATWKLLQTWERRHSAASAPVPVPVPAPAPAPAPARRVEEQPDEDEAYDETYDKADDEAGFSDGSGGLGHGEGQNPNQSESE